MRLPLLPAASLAALAALCAGPPRALPAQSVGIDPHVVFLTHRARSGGLTLYNTAPQPVEVTVSTVYGYIATDSLGGAVVHFPEAPTAAEPNAAPWVAVYPRRMTIPAGGEQEVRFLARPADTLPDGEYWARVVVSARNVEPPLATAEDSADVQVRIAMETRTVLPLFYRQGQLTTGIALSQLAARADGDSLRVSAQLARTGTAAFVGTVRLSVADAAGRPVAGMERPIAVYRTASPRWAVALPAGLAPGRYAVMLALSTERADVAATQLLRAQPVQQSVELIVP